MNKYFEDQKSILDYLNLKSAVVTNLAQKIILKSKSDQNIWVVGNGGSASTSSHFVCDLAKGVFLNRGQKFRVYSLSDNIPMLTAYGNDLNFDRVYSEQLKNYGKQDDLLLILSGSGNSKNLIECAITAKKNGIEIFGILGNAGGSLLKHCDESFIIPSSDMQIVENTHLIIVHFIFKILSDNLNFV